MDALNPRLTAVASALLGAGAFAAWSHLRYQRSSIASLAEYGVRPVKMLTTRISMADYLARRAAGPEPRRRLSFPLWSRSRYNVELREDEGMPVYRLTPLPGAGIAPATGRGSVVVYLHGGGYTSTASVGHALFIDSLIRATGAHVVVPLPPLAPHHTWEETHRLVLDLYSRVLTDYPDSRIILMGDSSGGGLALAIALSLVDRGLRQPDELVLISPWVDVTHTNPDIPSYAAVDPLMSPGPLTLAGRYWAGDTPTADWHLSPINADSSAFAVLGRVTTFVGSREMFLPDNALLHDRLVSAGVDSTLHVGRNLNHVYPMVPSPEGRRARREIARLIRRA